ncbi:hypothetical protein G5T42_03510 [Microbacterium sp. 4R-513]|uniref:DUF6766 family protein n=1 Tax=Microbacterium sp. 4R-513 TaxID=2567934 RepID=UPI0013E1FF8E|nr:DUF6766 family protein [Microbacterium sp. 4R-513]QIG38666.1 hypothetical protein G5T42_03510 [Microbacterium sp. 4R-513]
MKFLRNNALSLFFLAIFVAAIIGQSIAGWFDQNEQLTMHGEAPVAFLQFVTSSDFVVDVAENWQSEFLQFFLFIAATIWLVQKGSPESKKPGEQGVESDEEQYVGQYAVADSPTWAKVGGFRGWLYANSLLLVMGVIFLLSWLGQSVAGTVVANEEQAEHGLPAMTWGDYVVSPDFWNRTLQNWQSEFLAVGCMVAFSIYLRQRGSSESKEVGAPHHAGSMAAE